MVNLEKIKMPNMEYLQDSPFEQIRIRNFKAQSCSSRYPPSEDFPNGQSPVVRLWRLNLTALSSKYNLYFVASEGELLVFTPQDVRNTILGCAQIKLSLPRTSKASTVQNFQSLDPARPHCVNNIKIGNLGNLEVVVLALDDGDVVAYYTHTIDYQVRQVINKEVEVIISRPFLHENVRSSAWGLALHQQSRLIAVGSNRHEITIFALACNKKAGNKHENNFSDSNSVESTPNTNDSSDTADSPCGPLWLTLESFELAFLSLEPPFVSNLRIQKDLPPAGHNIPSLEFTSDEEGNVSTVLAADVRGNLWQFNPFTSEISHLPDMTREVDDDGSMAWGVIVVPKTMFIDCKTPCEALGTDMLMASWITCAKLSPFQSCFNANTSIYLPKNELYPKRHNSFGDQCLILLDGSPHLKLGEEGENSYNDYTEMRAKFEMMRRQIFEATHNTTPVVDMIRGDIWSFISRYMKLIMCQQSQTSLDEMVLKVERAAKNTARDYAILLTYLRYHLDLDVDFRRLEIRLHHLDVDNTLLQVERLRRIGDDLMKTHVGLFKNPPKYRFPTIADSVQQGKLKPENARPISQDGSAVLMTYRQDLLLLPPYPFAMPQTICKGILSPAPDTPGNFERLCFHALIPPLKLVVVGGQRGRAILLSVTRMPACMSNVAEVIAMRVEVILPLGRDDHHRPQSPLMGLAVSPVGGAERKKGLAAPAWRLLLHYADHTILSYELHRDNEHELVVF